MLIDTSVNMNVEIAEGSVRTALQVAAEHGHKDIVKLKAVDVSAAKWLGRAALQAAIEYRHEAVVQLLIDKRAHVI